MAVSANNTWLAKRLAANTAKRIFFIVDLYHSYSFKYKKDSKLQSLKNTRIVPEKVRFFKPCT